LLATAGLPDPELPPPAPAPFVAIAVGKTKEGESLPANPGACQQTRGGLSGADMKSHLVLRTLCRYYDHMISAKKFGNDVSNSKGGHLLVHDNGGGLGRHGCEDSSRRTIRYAHCRKDNYQ
jgi:hypothetical protein